MTTTSQISSNATANVANYSPTNAFDMANGASIIDQDVDNDQTSIAKELNATENGNNNGGIVNSNNDGANNLRGADGKRKKLKSRNIPTTPNSGYSKENLDAWLETCLKDISQEQLSSSSEFLDYNPIMTTATGVNGSKQKQNQSSNVIHNTIASQQNQQQQQQQQMPQPNFGNGRNSAKGNAGGVMSGFPTGYSAPFSQSFQRSMPNFTKSPSNAFSTNRFSSLFCPSSGGGFYGPIHDNSQDFASLPPIVNLLGNYGGNIGAGNGAASSEHENHSTDVLDGSGSNPNICRGFRFSDPCLLNPSDNDSKRSGQNTPDRRQNMPSELENNKFFVALMEQINILHETNSKICRNLHETKVDIEALKHAPTWGLRQRRESVSGLSAHSQPMIFGGGFGTQSPAPTYHSGAYTPGIMTDVVREVKEAARVREDAMLNRVKALVEERQWSMNEGNLRMMRDIEELKSQINFLRSDRKETNKRITHLEAENKYMRQLLANIYNTTRNQQLSGGRDTIYEHEMQRPRKTLSHSQHPHSRRAQSLNLHYGTIHHQAASSLSLEEQEEDALHIIEKPTAMPDTNFSELKQQKKIKHQQPRGETRSSFSSSDGSNGVTGSGENINTKTLAMSPPKFALVPATSAPAQSSMENPLQKPKRKNKDGTAKQISSEESSIQQQKNSDQLLQPSEPAQKLNTQELQRELNDAVAARQNADDRIIAIEKLVKNLHVNATHPSDALDNGDGNHVRNNLTFNSGYGINQTSATNLNSSKQHINIINHFAKSQQYASAPSRSLLQQQMSNGLNNSTACTAQLNQQNSAPKLSVAGPITDL